MAQGILREGDCNWRELLFNEVLQEAGLERRLSLTQTSAGLGLRVQEAVEVGSELLCCDSQLVYSPGARCKEVENIRATLPHPALLPLPCYCAALASMPMQFQSTQAASDVSKLPHGEKRLFALSRPEILAARAPGISELEVPEGDRMLVDATAVAIARAFGVAENFLSDFCELAKIWRCNAFELGEGQLGIFLLPALCNHSCNPAAEYKIDSLDGRITITLTACRRLAPGDDLTISYIDTTASRKPSRAARRKELAAGWFFFCCCRSCVRDPHEPRTPVCTCGQELSVWISDLHGGPYEDTQEAPTCDACGEVDLVVSGSYFYHCTACEVDLCPDCGDKAVTRAACV